MPWFVTSFLGEFGVRKERPNLIEDFGVGCGIGTRRSSDGGLVNDDDLVDVFDPRQGSVTSGKGFSTVNLALQCRCKDAGHQRGFSRPRDTGHRRHAADGKGDVDVLQVVVPCALHLEVTFAGFGSLVGPGYGFPAAQVGTGDGVLTRHHFIGRPVGDDHAPLQPSTWTEVAQPICLTKGVFVVLDHQEGVSKVAEFSKGLEEAVVVSLVQANGRFVQHVHDARQAAADLRGQANALALSA